MADSAAPNPGLGDLLGLFGGSNPFAGVQRSIGQFQRGVTQFLDSVEQFSATMVQMNLIAARVNSLLDEVEPPIKALMPQVTRTLLAADAMVEQLSAPIERVAPGLSRLADTLSAPQITALPKDLAEFMNVLSDVARRLQPLGQLAESAGGLFGLRSLGALRAASTRQASGATLTETPLAATTPVKR